MYGLYGESSVNRSSGRAFAPNGEFDETCTNRVVWARRARSMIISVPPTLTSKNSRVRLSGMDHRRRMEHRGAVDPVEEAVGRDRVPDVADDDLDLRADELEQRRFVGRVDQAAHALAGRHQLAHEVRARASPRHR